MKAVGLLCGNTDAFHSTADDATRDELFPYLTQVSPPLPLAALAATGSRAAADDTAATVAIAIAAEASAAAAVATAAAPVATAAADATAAAVVATAAVLPQPFTLMRTLPLPLTLVHCWCCR